MCSLFTVWASARLFPHFFVFLICVPSTFVPCTFIPCTLFPAYSFLALLFPSYLFPAYLFMTQSPHIRIFPVTFSPAYLSIAHCSSHTRTLHICSPYISSLQFVPRTCTLHFIYHNSFLALYFLHGDFSSTKSTP
jgi:hypothetical protein